MTRTFEIPEHPSPQLKTVLRYLDSVKVFDLAEIKGLFADDFVQSTRPLSLGVPSRTKEEDLAFLGGFSEKLQGRHLEVTIYDFVESPGKAWAHVCGNLPIIIFSFSLSSFSFHGFLLCVVAWRHAHAHSLMAFPNFFF
ncbi:hypothetical protein BJV74DRAFT_865523 [Russula compacta]|nr:hypothetical protein BJV74DRAFT_865523 [Russula compacta]